MIGLNLSTEFVKVKDKNKYLVTNVTIHANVE